MPLRYISNARTLEELRQEFLSDIQRRLSTLDIQTRNEKSASKKAAIGHTQQELQGVLEFWTNVEVKQRAPRAVNRTLVQP